MVATGCEETARSCPPPSLRIVKLDRVGVAADTVVDAAGNQRFPLRKSVAVWTTRPFAMLAVDFQAPLDGS